MSFFSFQDIITCVTGIMILLMLTIILELLVRKTSASIPTPQPDIAAQQKELETLRKQTDENRDALATAIGRIAVSQNTLDILRRELKGINDEIRQTQDSCDSETQRKKETLEKIEKLKKSNRELLLELQELNRPQGSKTAITVTLRQRQADARIPLWVELGKNEITVNKISLISGDTGIVEKVASFNGDGCAGDFLKWADSSGKCSPAINKFVLLVRPDAIKEWGVISATLKNMGFVTGSDTWGESRRLNRSAGVK